MEGIAGGLQGQLVSDRAQTADHAAGNIGQIGTMAKGFPGVDIREVHLDERYSRRQQGVPQGDAGMGIGPRVEQDRTRALGLGLVGLAPILVGLLIVIMNNRFGRRTAEGSAVLAQAKGFELYLRTAEADQIRFEESIDVFSRYLPYAIVFGVADRWSAIFQRLAAEGRYQGDTSWYVGPSGYFYASSFGNSMDSLASSLSASMTSATVSSSGSGFSGGGGFGGGGGGGW